MSMIKIEVTGENVDVKNRKKKDGTPITFHEQSAWAYFCEKDGNPQPHPQRITLTLDDGAPAYQRGIYYLSGTSFYLGDFGSIRVRARLMTQAEAYAVAVRLARELQPAKAA